MSSTTVPSKRMGPRVLNVIAALVIVIAGLKAAQAILIPFLFAIFLAILGSLPVTFLQRNRVPKLVAVAFVAICMISVFVAIGAVLGGSVQGFTDKMPEYQQRLDQLSLGLNQWLAERSEIQVDSTLILQSIEPSRLMNLIGSTLKGLVSALSKTTLVTILVMFMLVEAAGFKRKLRAAFGEVVELDRVRGITRDVRRYLGIKTVTSAITGLLVGGWATLMDVDFPWLWAFVAFLFNYVPFVGSIIAAIPAVLLALLVHSVPVTLVVAIGYIVINVGVSNFLEPIIMGQGLGLSPLVVFCSLVVWGWVWGPAGALMSVPLTMIVKIFLEHTVEFRWIAVLMGPSPRGDS